MYTELVKARASRESKDLGNEGFVGAPMNDVDVESIDPKAAASQVRVRSIAVSPGLGLGAAGSGFTGYGGPLDNVS